MNLREDIIKLSGREIITEGVNFFKISPKIDKLITKISKSKGDVKPKVELIKDFKIAKIDFKKAEEMFQTGDKEKGKKLYKEAKVKHSKIVKKILRKDIAMFLIKSGIFAAIASVVSILFNTYTPEISTVALPEAPPINVPETYSNSNVNRAKIESLMAQAVKKAENLYTSEADQWKYIDNSQEWKQIDAIVKAEMNK